ncbi:diguanylate cyclase domain-containing protein [Paraburkholderia sp.]|uniref:GGDEF domain-containing protein n=1 Tax=Paraburkholderia sp. TaxID=1926495 RepID=UPI003D6ECB9D
MRSSPKPTRLALLALLFLGAHAICIATLRSSATSVSYLFLVLAPSLALAGCCWRARAEERQSRTLWVLLGAGMFLWICGIALSAWEDLVQQLPPNVTWFSDFSFFLYGVPILLAISFGPNERQIPFFVWIDAAQAVLTGYLAYMVIFSVAPFSDHALEPIPVSSLVLTYNVENVVLAIAATLRLLVQPRGKDRAFYVILCGYLWIYAVIAAVYNNWAATSSGGRIVLDIIVDVPFLLLGIACLMRPAQQIDANAAENKRPLAVVIENGTSVFYTIALLILSVVLIHDHFEIGVVGVFTALLVYMLRTTALQSRLFETQQALSRARDILEEMALTDALTQTANRRCFDQTLAIEWERAVRDQVPLSLLLIDIDYFKQLNDRYGHPAGDQCLVAVAGALQSMLPRGNLLARYGGEEFAAIMPAAYADYAQVVADNMLEAVSVLRIRNETSLGNFVTVSIGIAVSGAPDMQAPHQIVETADRALYHAKERGRNRAESVVQHESLDSADPLGSLYD